jgi:hypothetical protein
MLCPNGHVVTEDARFCPSCGAAVGPSERDATDAGESSQVAAEEGVTSAPERRRHTLLFASIAAVLVIGVGVAVGGGILLFATDVFSGGKTHTLNGILTAPECGGGYAIENANVELRDESNKLIGSAVTSSRWATVTDECKVEFRIDDVPQSDFYQLKVGTHGAPSYTYDELNAQGWNLGLSLGD